MKLFSVEYNPEENEGVYALSVVKNPAMQSNWITLSKQHEFKLATVDNEKRILMGIALIPNKPIYRNDENGEYNIIFSTKVIEQAAHDFVRKGNVNNSTEEHKIDLGGDAVSVVESWIIEDDNHDKTRKFGFKEPVGSWAVMMKVHDDEIWQKAKSGEIKGFSIDGLFNLKKINKNVNMSEEKKSISLAEKFGNFLFGLAEQEEQPKEKEVKMGMVSTTDGVEIMFDGEELSEGSGVFIENEGERVPLPVGEYEVEGGQMLVVAEEGIFAGYKAKEEEPDMELSEEEEEKFFKMLDKMFGLSDIKKNVETLKTQLSEVKTENETLKVQLSEYGKQPAVEKVVAKKENEKVDLSEPKNNAQKIYNYIKNNKR